MLDFCRHFAKGLIVLQSKEENVYGEERPYEVPAEEEEDIYAQFKAWKVTVIARQEIE